MITITITNSLEDFWATDEQFASMTDAEIVDLVKEDLTAFIENASWSVTR